MLKRAAQKQGPRRPGGLEKSLVQARCGPPQPQAWGAAGTVRIWVRSEVSMRRAQSWE